MAGTGDRRRYGTYVEQLRVAAVEEAAARTSKWREATPEEHGDALLELLALADEILRSRGRPPRKPALPAERFPWPSLRAPR